MIYKIDYDKIVNPAAIKNRTMQEKDRQGCPAKRLSLKNQVPVNWFLNCSTKVAKIFIKRVN